MAYPQGAWSENLEKEIVKLARFVYLISPKDLIIYIELSKVLKSKKVK